MAKDPAGRFPSAAAVAGLLEGYLAHLRQPATVAAPEPSDLPEKTASERSHRRIFGRVSRRIWPAAVGVLAVLALGAFFLFHGGADQPRPEAEGKKQEKQEHVVFDFRRGIDSFPSLLLDGPEADSVVKTERRGCASRWLKEDGTPTPSAWKCRIPFMAILTSPWVTSCCPSARLCHNTERDC